MSDPWFNNWKQYTDHPRVEDAFKTQADRSDTLTEEEQNELARWFLAESEWYAARREWEQNGYFNELLAQQEELARWLLAESEWMSRQNARRAEHYAAALMADNQLSRWLLAETEWEAGKQDARRRRENHELFRRYLHLEDEAVNSITVARWLIAEAEWKADVASRTHDRAWGAIDKENYTLWWLLAEARWKNGGREPENWEWTKACFEEDIDLALWLLAEKEWQLDRATGYWKDSYNERGKTAEYWKAACSEYAKLLRAQRQNVELALWLHAELQHESGELVEELRDATSASRLGRWLLAEQAWCVNFHLDDLEQSRHRDQKIAWWLLAEAEWKAGQEFLRGLAAPRANGIADTA